jgi:Chemoreceptor zinc-binding domain
MANIEELDKAIEDHGMWKARLRKAIDTGKTEASVDTIRQDNQCVFGKWLYGATLTAVDKALNHYKTVKDLHAEFHKTAAAVAEVAVGGKKAEAEKMMARGGEFSTVSIKLTQAMLEWKKVSK